VEKKEDGLELFKDTNKWDTGGIKRRRSVKEKKKKKRHDGAYKGGEGKKAMRRTAPR